MRGFFFLLSLLFITSISSRLPLGKSTPGVVLSLCIIMYMLMLMLMLLGPSLSGEDFPFWRGSKDKPCCVCRVLRGKTKTFRDHTYIPSLQSPNLTIFISTRTRIPPCPLSRFRLRSEFSQNLPQILACWYQKKKLVYYYSYHKRESPLEKGPHSLLVLYV